MKLTEEQKIKLAKLKAWYEEKSGLRLNTEDIVKDFSDNLETMNFQEAYTKTYLDAIGKQVVPQVCDSIKKGGEPYNTGAYFSVVMDYLYKTFAPEEVLAKDAANNKELGTLHWIYHLEAKEYNQNLQACFQANTGKFQRMPRYKAIAEKKVVYTQGDHDPAELAYETITSSLSFLKSDVRTGDVDVEELKESLASVAESYMVINARHNSLGLLSKWFGKGSEYRGLMDDVKEKLNEARDYLIQHGHPELKDYNVRNELHRIGVINYEVIGPDAEALHNAYDDFDGALAKKDLPDLEDDIFAPVKEVKVKPITIIENEEVNNAIINTNTQDNIKNNLLIEDDEKSEEGENLFDLDDVGEIVKDEASEKEIK